MEYPTRHALTLAALDDFLATGNSDAPGFMCYATIGLALPLWCTRLNEALAALGLHGVFIPEHERPENPGRVYVGAFTPDGRELLTYFEREVLSDGVSRIRGIEHPVQALLDAARRWRAVLAGLTTEQALHAAMAGHPCFDDEQAEAPKRKPGRKPQHSGRRLRNVQSAWVAYRDEGRGSKADFFDAMPEAHGCNSLAELKRLLDTARKLPSE